MTTIKNVVVLGATGKVGLQIVHALSKVHFTVTAAFRSAPNISPLPPNVHLATVDYSSPTSLTTLSQNQDAVIEAFNPSLLTTHHRTLTDAIISSNIKHITADFSSDTFNPHAHELEIFEPKLAAQKYLEEKVKGTETRWTAVITGPLFDWALPEECFWLSPTNKTITVFGSGNQRVSMSRLSSTGRAVVAILSSPTKYQDHPAYFADYTVSTNQLVELMQGIVRERGEDMWKVVNVELEGFFEEGKRLYGVDTEMGEEDRLKSRAY